MKSMNHELRIRKIRIAVATALVAALVGQGAITTVLGDEGAPAGGGQDLQLAAEELYTQEGEDPSRDELIANGSIVFGGRFSTRTVLGSKIRVNHKLLEQQTGPLGPSSVGGIHTPDSGTRWSPQATTYKPSTTRSACAAACIPAPGKDPPPVMPCSSSAA